MPPRRGRRPSRRRLQSRRQRSRRRPIPHPEAPRAPRRRSRPRLLFRRRPRVLCLAQRPGGTPPQCRRRISLRHRAPGTRRPWRRTLSDHPRSLPARPRPRPRQGSRHQRSTQHPGRRSRCPTDRLPDRTPDTPNQRPGRLPRSPHPPRAAAPEWPRRGFISARSRYAPPRRFCRTPRRVPLPHRSRAATRGALAWSKAESPWPGARLIWRTSPMS